MPKVIAITSEKGGVGKSTLAVHLSGALAERGLAVTLIDEDGRVGVHDGQRMPSSSTSKISVAPGGMTPPAPRAP